MRKAFSRRVSVLAGSAILLAGLAGAKSEPAGSAPIHDDAAAVEAATTGALRAFLSEDVAAARKELDRIAAHTRDPKVEEEAVFGERMFDDGKAFRATINLAREHSGAGDVDAAFRQFLFVQHACRNCHKGARQQGLIQGKASHAAE